ncbi:MAG TPA: HAD-IIIC family phosphatase, partial [Gemmatimonadaceae bacterium]|nr:HAD-IIIC family phosphatase [Gemmatimonadaceae bacterium]
HPHIRALGSRAILERYPVRELHDPHSRQAGHVPFTTEGYAAIGTALFRAVFRINAPLVKVIALDCDNTLWQGVCGEDGPEGVAVTAPFRRLQEFMIAQTRAGVLIALCSKNNEADALAVFDRHPGMALRREHLAGWCINWDDKPSNLRTLAAKFNLGLDSFVFIDDNPLECAAVRAACPEVTVLQLPTDHERIPAFLENIWLFDHASATREDQERSQWYRANAEREEMRAAAPTLHDFLESLQLRVEIAEPTDDQLARVAQLTLRTNQFNFTSIRRSEAEVRALLASGGRCLVTTVKDRFGDYGLVGVTLYTAESDSVTVDTLLLSCRALGKGVEHRMVAELAKRALREGKSLVKMHCRPNDRNAPAIAFFERLGAVARTPSELSLDLPASTLADLRYNPEEQSTANAASNQSTRPEKFVRANFSAVLQRIGEEFTSAAAVVAAIETSNQTHSSETIAELEPNDGASSLEHSLAAIWKKALHRPHIGYNERFFDAGGTSLKAVMVVAMIRRELKKDISIVTLFESPTIKLLAARLEASDGAKTASTEAAESRGRARRQKLLGRKGRSV